VYWKRRLPHWIPEGATIFVTWRVDGDARWLDDPRLAQVIVDALFYGSRHRYDLHAWVVMPTHVHVVLTPKRPFSEIMRWLKWTTARRCNQLLNRNGIFWQDESFDHWIRNNELGDIIAYVEGNPVAAGLENWPWSSKTVGQAILSPAIGETGASGR